MKKTWATPPETRRRVAGYTAGCAIVLNLVGCAVTGTYPAEWPETVRGEQVGKCPSIAGKYRSRGVQHPPDAPALSLTELMGLGQGDYVDIAQSPDTISVSAWAAGRLVDTRTFSSGESPAGWDMNRPQTFNCPMDVTSGRVLSFAHLEGGSTQFVGATQGTVAFTVNAGRVARTADGSLVVMLQTGVGGLIGPVPVGHFKRVWYLFGPLEPQ